MVGETFFNNRRLWLWVPASACFRRDDEAQELHLGQRRSALRLFPDARPVADMANEGLKKSVVYDRLSFLLYD